MEENITEYQSTSRLIESCVVDQNNKDRQKCNNFSIESILSSASSALALAAKQEASRSDVENGLNLHPALLGQDILGSNQRFHGKLSRNDDLDNQVVEHKLEHKKEDNEEDDDDVVVGSRSSSPSQPNTPKLFNHNISSAKFPMFDLSKGKMF